MKKIKERIISTKDEDYTHSLVTRQYIWWKQLLNVQLPYRWNIRHLSPGFVLDIGCGIGRNLLHLDGNGVGIDHNEESVKRCESQGLTAFTVENFAKSAYNQPKRFDSILLAHVAEHMSGDTFVEILKQYLPLLKHNGSVIIITPQERGFKSDTTHVQFMDFKRVKEYLTLAGLNIAKQYSFPFPRPVGRIFKYNEFVTVAIKK